MTQTKMVLKSVNLFPPYSKERFGRQCSVDEQVLFYIMLPYVHVLAKTTDSWVLSSTVWYEYVAKPPLSLQLYKTSHKLGSWSIRQLPDFNLAAAWSIRQAPDFSLVSAWFWSSSRLIDQGPAWFQSGGCLMNQAVPYFQIFRFPTVKLEVIQ